MLTTGCARKPPRLVALVRARDAAEATNNPTYRLSLLTGVGVEWLRLDRREGGAILRDVLEMAQRADAHMDARADAVERSAAALAEADPAHAVPILLDGWQRLDRIDPRSDARYPLLAALASRDVKRALRLANRLPGAERALALAHIARAIAGADAKRATELMASAISAPSPIASESDRWWAEVAVAAAAKDPTAAVTLAGDHVSEPRLRARVLFAAVEAVTAKDQSAARRLIAAEGRPDIQVWGWMGLAHASRGGQREAACQDAQRALRDEWAAAMLPKWLPEALRDLGVRVVRTTMRPHISRSVRFSLVAQWSLFAALESESSSKGYPGPAERAARYLASAEEWTSKPPRDAELGMVMAAASYVDPAKALRIHEALLRRAPATHMEAAPWVALTGTAHLIARVDPAAAKRMLAREPAELRRLVSPSTQLATIGERLVLIGEPKRATAMLADAQRALEAQKLDARRHRNDGARQRHLWESMRWVAIGLAEVGKPEQALRAADEIRDRGKAAETYLAIAQILGGARPKRPDRFEAVKRAAVWLDGMTEPQAPLLPWTPSAQANLRFGPPVGPTRGREP